MRIWLLAVLVLPGLLTCQALTTGEEEALSAILEAWPILAEQSPRWSYNVSLACSGDGFYGVKCSSSPSAHIVGMYVVNIIDLTCCPFFAVC